MKTESAAARVFFALSDETRLALIAKMNAPISATSLSAVAAVTRQAIVKHLRVLQDAGLVSHRKQGRQVLYRLEPRRLAVAQQYLQTISARWDRAIDRLRYIVEEQPPHSPRRPARRSTRRR